MKHPDAKYPEKIGEYPALVKSGGGYIWDEVLEYRVWCHPERGAEDKFEGDDYFYSFATYSEAEKFANNNTGTEKPLVLVLQKEYIDEPVDGEFNLIKEERITEWACGWLSRSRRNQATIDKFFLNPSKENLYLLRE